MSDVKSQFQFQLDMYFDFTTWWTIFQRSVQLRWPVKRSGSRGRREHPFNSCIELRVGDDRNDCADLSPESDDSGGEAEREMMVIVQKRHAGVV